MTDIEYRAFADDCLDEVAARRHQTAELFLADVARPDLNESVIQYFFHDQLLVEAQALFVGTWSSHSASWMWAWANPSLPQTLHAKMSSLKELATSMGRAEFAAENAFQIEDGRSQELAAVACHHFGGIGVWKQPMDQIAWAYFVILGLTPHRSDSEMTAMAEASVQDSLSNGRGEGPDWLNTLRQRFPNLRVDVIGADLRGPAKPYSLDLHTQILFDSDRLQTNEVRDLAGANLSQARLDGVILRGVLLKGASFDGASLVDADLCGADLRNASLHNAFLNGVNFTRANLEGANFSGAELSRTLLVDVDLSRIVGMEDVHHLTPSEVSFSTLLASKFEINVQFLRNAGVSNGLIQDLISGQRLESTYQTCFLSYSTKDSEFANRLHESLMEAGIRVFQDRFDFIAGDQLEGQIADAIREHKRLIVVLSVDSMQSEWVELEVQLAWHHDPKSLLPIRLCPIEDVRTWTASRSGFPDLANNISIQDFTLWKQPEEYQLGLANLLRALVAGAKPATPKMASQTST